LHPKLALETFPIPGDDRQLNMAVRLSQLLAHRLENCSIPEVSISVSAKDQKSWATLDGITPHR
jgi:hypothetical protein